MNRLLAALLLAAMTAACGGDSGSGPEDDGGTPDGGPVDNGGTAVVDSTKPERLEPVALFAADSPFNTPLPADAAVDPASPTMVTSLVAAGSFVVQVGQYSAPVYLADESTPRHDVQLACGDVWELGVNVLRDVPIPDHAEPGFDADGADNPPRGCGEDSDQDNNLIVLDTVRRCEYDFWQARRDNGGWVASWGNGLSLDGPGVYPHGMSARGSGFAFLGGVIWPHELAAGRIDHALVISYPYTKSGGPVPPATESDGWSDQDWAIPEGARLQLDPALDLDALNLTPHERTLARAMQEYGLLLVDTGGDGGIGLYAIDPRSVQGNPYDGLLPAGDFVTLGNIPVDRLRVLELPPQNGGWQAGLFPEVTDCAAFE